VKVGIKRFRPLPGLILLGTGPRRSERLNPPERPSSSSISARVTKRSRTILNDNTRKTQSMRNKTLQKFVQYSLKIQLETQYAVDALQDFHNFEAAQLKRLKSAQKAMKKHLATLQDKITNDYGPPGKDEHES
jgi:hypothetical protein